jgi:hypothetical protein
VRVLAETLDTARRIGGMKGGYLAVQALPPYQRGLHALRLPVELTAVSQSVPTGRIVRPIRQSGCVTLSAAPSDLVVPAARFLTPRDHTRRTMGPAVARSPGLAVNR